MLIILLVLGHQLSRAPAGEVAQRDVRRARRRLEDFVEPTKDAWPKVGLFSDRLPHVAKCENQTWQTLSKV